MPVPADTERTRFQSLPPDRPARDSRPSPPRHVPVVAGSGPHMSSVTAALLHARLRAVALFFVATIAVFIVWRGLVLRDGSLSPLQPSVLCFELAVFALLSSPARLPVRALGAVELTTFGLMVTLLATPADRDDVPPGRPAQRGLARGIDRGDPVAATILIMAHAMLIPNTWRGASWGVLGLAAVPFATIGVLILAHPEALGLIHGAVTFERVAQDLLLTLVGAGLAIYGTHVLGSLRAEAFEARRLNQYQLLRRLGRGGWARSTWPSTGC